MSGVGVPSLTEYAKVSGGGAIWMLLLAKCSRTGVVDSWGAGREEQRPKIPSGQPALRSACTERRARKRRHRPLPGRLGASVAKMQHCAMLAGRYGRVW